METIHVNIDPENFPQLNMRYAPDRLKDLLVKMCQGLELEITEANLYFMAANVESDLQHLFEQLMSAHRNRGNAAYVALCSAIK
jgi:hypothetical protein